MLIHLLDADHRTTVKQECDESMVLANRYARFVVKAGSSIVYDQIIETACFRPIRDRNPQLRWEMHTEEV